MCHQTVGLAQAALEQVGIVTASITALPEITTKVGVPRALEVPFRLGYPFGEANRPELQLQVLRTLLALTERADAPLWQRFDPALMSAGG